MAKFRWHHHASGAMWRFKEYGYEDMITVSKMYSLKKEDFLKLVDPDNLGRKRKPTSRRAYAKLVKTFWRKVVDRMMESERFIINDELSMYIGRVDPDKNNPAIGELQDIRTTHGVILNGFFHNYYFRMPYRRRRELRDRLKKGQSFIT